jgi:hypothetical protein
MRALARQGSSTLLLVGIMLLGSLVLWIGVPLACLWVGSVVMGATANIGAAIAAMFSAAAVLVVLLVSALGWLSEQHRRVELIRGNPRAGHAALETVLVASAGIAILAVTIWLLGFAGTGLLPVLPQ